MIKIDKKKNGVYQFKVKSATGRTLLKSVPFSNKDELDKTLNDFKAQKEAKLKFFERKTNTEGKFLIILKNHNGQTVGSSALYASEAGMENGIINISNSLESGLK